MSCVSSLVFTQILWCWIYEYFLLLVVAEQQICFIWGILVVSLHFELLITMRVSASAGVTFYAWVWLAEIIMENVMCFYCWRPIYVVIVQARVSLFHSHSETDNITEKSDEWGTLSVLCYSAELLRIRCSVSWSGLVLILLFGEQAVQLWRPQCCLSVHQIHQQQFDGLHEIF